LCGSGLGLHQPPSLRVLGVIFYRLCPTGWSFNMKLKAILAFAFLVYCFGQGGYDAYQDRMAEVKALRDLCNSQPTATQCVARAEAAQARSVQYVFNDVQDRAGSRVTSYAAAE
jgi:hypothetical protein